MARLRVGPLRGGMAGPWSADLWSADAAPPAARPPDGNCAAPLRARAPPAPSGRIRIPGRRGERLRGGGGGGTGPTDRGARAAPLCGGPARLRPRRGRCSPKPRDEPGERGDPSTPCPARADGDRAAAAAASLRGCVTLAAPHPLWAEPGRTDPAAGGHSEFRPRGRGTGLGAGEAPGRRGLARGLPGLAWDQQLGARAWPRLGLHHPGRWSATLRAFSPSLRLS